MYNLKPAHYLFNTFGANQAFYQWTCDTCRDEFGRPRLCNCGDRLIYINGAYPSYYELTCDTCWDDLGRPRPCNCRIEPIIGYPQNPECYY